jgi:sulfatase maturation enzyme AslB (radical SAM superfamily)
LPQRIFPIYPPPSSLPKGGAIDSSRDRLFTGFGTALDATILRAMQLVVERALLPKPENLAALLASAQETLSEELQSEPGRFFESLEEGTSARVLRGQATSPPYDSRHRGNAGPTLASVPGLSKEVLIPWRTAVTHAHLSGAYREETRYPAATVNVTNHCNLRCEHCFVFRDGSPNRAPRSIRDEMNEDTMLETLAALRDRHGIRLMLWMGGEPLLRKTLVARGVRLFPRNTITTNGTIPLLDLGPRVLYVVSLDGPEGLNDSIRGPGVFRRVLDNLAQLPEGFSSPVQAQCVVTRQNQWSLEDLVRELLATRIGWMTFSFYVPRRGETEGNAWPDNAARAPAVRGVLRLKREFPGFVRNSKRSLELMLPGTAQEVTTHCPARRSVLPLYLEEDHFSTPFCCYGNDVDCDRCGGWVVFHLAASQAPRG